MLLRHRTTVGSDQIVLQRSVSSKASGNTSGNLAKKLLKVIQVELFDAQEKHYICIFKFTIIITELLLKLTAYIVQFSITQFFSKDMVKYKINVLYSTQHKALQNQRLKRLKEHWGKTQMFHLLGLILSGWNSKAMMMKVGHLVFL